LSFHSEVKSTLPKSNHFELVESHKDLRGGGHASLDGSFTALYKGSYLTELLGLKTTSA